MSAARPAALAAHAAGLAVLPVSEDGLKRPDVKSWTEYQTRRPTDAEIETWYANGRTGVGLVCGAVSGGLEMLEFEGRALAAGLNHRFREIVEAAGLRDVLDRILAGYVERTPGGGFHLLYRCPTPRPNTKLASRPATDAELSEAPNEKVKVLIETRGEGGFVVVAPSHGGCHPSGRPWTLVAGGFDSIAAITDEERDELFRIAQALDEMPAEAPRPTGRASGDARPGDRPGDRLAADPDVQSFMLDLLVRHGWTHVYTKGGVDYLCRPGKDRGISATLGYGGPGVLHVFSTSTEFDATSTAKGKAGRSHAPFSVYAGLEHGDDYAEAARALAERYPEPRLGFDFGVRPDVGPSDASAASSAATRAPARLPDEFSEARPSLAHIRQAARSRQRAPDSVLGAVLARTAALLPHTLGLPPTVGAEVGLSLMVAIVSGSGHGKTGAASIADDLVPHDLHAIPSGLAEIPSGSGEGLAESFFDWVETTDDNGKPKEEKQQVRHNLFAYLDEMQKATRQAAQASSTLFATYRSAFTGSVLGEANASAERRRIVPAGSYSIGIVAAAQPEVLGPLFDDLAVGTPQRFLYFAGTDPTLPDEPPRWPGPLSRTPIDLERAERAFLAIRPHHVRIHINVAAEICQGDLLRQRGQDSGGPWAAHRNLLRLKVAALVAVLDGGRVDVSEDDWRLAGMVVDVSDAVRTGAQRALAASAAEREAETSLRYAQRAVHADKLTEDRRTLACVDAIVAKVTRKPGELTRGKLRASMGARQRDFFGEAFDRAIDFGVIEERSQPGQGEDRARLYPKGARR